MRLQDRVCHKWLQITTRVARFISSCLLCWKMHQSAFMIKFAGRLQKQSAKIYCSLLPRVISLPFASDGLVFLILPALFMLFVGLLEMSVQSILLRNRQEKHSCFFFHRSFCGIFRVWSFANWVWAMLCFHQTSLWPQGFWALQALRSRQWAAFQQWEEALDTPEAVRVARCLVGMAPLLLM